MLLLLFGFGARHLCFSGPDGRCIREGRETCQGTANVVVEDMYRSRGLTFVRAVAGHGAVVSSASWTLILGTVSATNDTRKLCSCHLRKRRVMHFAALNCEERRNPRDLCEIVTESIDDHGETNVSLVSVIAESTVRTVGRVGTVVFPTSHES